MRIFLHGLVHLKGDLIICIEVRVTELLPPPLSFFLSFFQRGSGSSATRMTICLEVRRVTVSRDADSRKAIKINIPAYQTGTQLRDTSSGMKYHQILEEG
jgi:hypothetical protein